MEPKSIPKRVKIEGDFQERKITLQDRLGEVWEPSWSDLGSSWLPSWAHFGMLFEKTYYFVTNHLFEKRRRQEATWSDLESIWAPKRLQNGSRGGSRKELS